MYAIRSYYGMRSPTNTLRRNESFSSLRFRSSIDVIIALFSKCRGAVVPGRLTVGTAPRSPSGHSYLLIEPLHCLWPKCFSFFPGIHKKNGANRNSRHFGSLSARNRDYLPDDTDRNHERRGGLTGHPDEICARRHCRKEKRLLLPSGGKIRAAEPQDKARNNFV